MNTLEFLKNFITDWVGLSIGTFIPYNDEWGVSFKILWNESNLEETLSKIKDLKDSDIYFQFWTEPSFNKKAKTWDIKMKNAFFIDVDIRKNQKDKDGTIMSDEELKQKIWFIKENLSKNDLLKDWYCIIFSGNWCHIRYIWNWFKVWEEVSDKDYKAWVNFIYNEFKRLFEEDETLYPDYSCTSIEKLARFPGTNNVKKRKDFGLDPIASEILFFQWSKTDIFNA